MYLYVIVVLQSMWNQLPTATANKLSKEENDYGKDYAKTMLSYMNSSVPPCTDFYEYACGNWKNVKEGPGTTTKRNNILDIEYKIDGFVENILQRPNINDVAPEYAAEFSLAKQFYDSCLKAQLHSNRPFPEYLTLLKNIGGFPAVDSNWDSENFDWFNMSAHLSNYNVENFVNEDIAPKYPFAPTFLLPKLGFDIKLHIDDIKKQESSYAYRENAKRMRHILTVYGVEKTKIDRIVAEIFDFLMEMLEVLNEFNDIPEIYEILSKFIKKSDILAIQNKWRNYHDIAWLGKTFQNSEQYCDYNICSLLYKILNEICEENKQAAANYLSLKFLFHMNVPFTEENHQKSFCTSTIKSSMKYFFDHLYMKLYFSDELRKEFHDVIFEIRHSLRTAIENAEWLDEVTRQAALLKESKIVENIGRYEDAAVTKTLIGELKNLKFVTGSFQENYLNLRKFAKYMERFNGLNYEKVNSSKPLDLLLGMQPQAFYYAFDNAIYVMAGCLEAPVYNKKWPNSLKFGTLGAIVGHELTHAFDTNGVNFDENGHYRKWCSPKSWKLFKERSQCFVNHYQRYFVPEINRYINGELTKNENIADNEGLNAALRAYRSLLMDSVQYKKEQLPGLDLSPEQLFFLGFAQIYCGSSKPMHYWKESMAPHTFDKYRVLGALSNNNDFARAYNCPLGTKMNPSANKCMLFS